MSGPWLASGKLSSAGWTTRLTKPAWLDTNRWHRCRTGGMLRVAGALVLLPVAACVCRRVRFWHHRRGDRRCRVDGAEVGDGAYGAVLAHGASRDAASWEEQATVMAEQGATVVAVEDISPEAIGDAVRQLQEDEIVDVAVVAAAPAPTPSCVWSLRRPTCLTSSSCCHRIPWSTVCAISPSCSSPAKESRWPMSRAGSRSRPPARTTRSSCYRARHTPSCALVGAAEA
jgi:hypothetical protein